MFNIEKRLEQIEMQITEITESADVPEDAKEVWTPVTQFQFEQLAALKAERAQLLTAQAMIRIHEMIMYVHAYKGGR